jgi:hypothetical protein
MFLALLSFSFNSENIFATSSGLATSLNQALLWSYASESRAEGSLITKPWKINLNALEN